MSAVQNQGQVPVSIPRTGWDYGNLGYSNIKHVVYKQLLQDSYGIYKEYRDLKGRLYHVYSNPSHHEIHLINLRNGQHFKCNEVRKDQAGNLKVTACDEERTLTFSRSHYSDKKRAWVDTSSKREVGGKRYCRVYEDKECIPGFPTMAFFISGVSGALAPAYAAGRLTGIVLTSPLLGFKDSAKRFVRMIFLMIGYFFAQVATVLESILISPEPVNGRRMVEKLEQWMNPAVDKEGNPAEGYLGIDQSVWLFDAPEKFPEDRFWHAGYIWCGCYQSHSVAELNDKNEIVAIRSYSGSRNFSILSTREHQTHLWTSAIQWIISKLAAKA